MNNAIEELVAFVGRDDTALKRYFDAEKKADFASMRADLNKFLRSTMDQVRVNRARQCTRRILKIADLDDLEHFREGVWKREATRGMAYDRQRDHTAHTLNNWLLGWYFYEKSRAIKEAINHAIDARGWDVQKKFGHEQYFGHTWQFTSLLHDIGYLFEGMLDGMDMSVQSAQATIGLRVTDEYFHLMFWKHMKTTSVHEQQELKNLIGEHAVPNEPSLSRISIYLRGLGDLGRLQEHVARALDANEKLRQFTPKALPGDAFDLWKQHFQAFNHEDAANRIDALEQAFLEDVTRGMPSLGIRVLDHGVCSGLLQLKIATFFYNLLANISAQRNGIPGRAKKKIEIREDETVDVKADYEFWWSGIVWATASAALHNMQQRGKQWCLGVEPGELKLADEPLTYLGVLVDCIQDWDRYFVFNSVERVPVQGVDVELGTENGLIVVKVPEKLQKKIVKDLTSALAGWDKIVKIETVAAA
jgi:hypothetical protein